MKYLATAFTITLLLSFMFIIGCGEEAEEEGGSNFPPIIDEIKAYGTIIKQGAPMPFKVLTTDWDGDLLEYTWEATAGQFDQTTGESVVWTAPDTPTTAEVTVSVNDGRSDPVTGTVSITVTPDEGLKSDIIGTWSLVSVDNKSLSDYHEEINLISIAEDEAGEETEFTVNVKYSSQEYVYKPDGTHAEILEFQYIIPKASGLLISNIVECTGEITGTYSLSGSELEISLQEEISIESSYKESQYNEEQKALLNEYIEVLNEAMKEAKSSIEPVEIVSAGNGKMEWANGLSWEKALVSVEYK